MREPRVGLAADRIQLARIDGPLRFFEAATRIQRGRVLACLAALFDHLGDRPERRAVMAVAVHKVVVGHDEVGIDFIDDLAHRIKQRVLAPHRERLVERLGEPEVAHAEPAHFEVHHRGGRERLAHAQLRELGADLLADRVLPTVAIRRIRSHDAESVLAPQDRVGARRLVVGMSSDVEHHTARHCVEPRLVKRNQSRIRLWPLRHRERCASVGDTQCNRELPTRQRHHRRLLKRLHASSSTGISTANWNRIDRTPFGSP